MIRPDRGKTTKGWVLCALVSLALLAPQAAVAGDASGDRGYAAASTAFVNPEIADSHEAGSALARNKEELTGAGAGALVGFAVGGPIGAPIGAAVGWFIGRFFN